MKQALLEELAADLDPGFKEMGTYHEKWEREDPAWRRDFEEVVKNHAFATTWNIRGLRFDIRRFLPWHKAKQVWTMLQIRRQRLAAIENLIWMRTT